MALSIDAATSRRKPDMAAPIDPKVEPNKKATEITQSAEVVEDPSSDGFDEGVDISLAPPIG